MNEQRTTIIPHLRKTIQELHTRINEIRADGNKFFNKYLTRKKVPLWTYPKDQLETAWRLTELYHRAKTAHDLGYTVILESTNAGLELYYLENLPTTRPGTF